MGVDLSSGEPERPPRSRTRTRAAIGVSLGLLAVAFVTACAFVWSIRVEGAEYLAQNDAIAQGVAASIEARQEGHLRVLQSYAGRFQFREDIKARHREAVLVHLRQLHQNFPELDRLFLADPAGILWASEPENPNAYGKSYAFRDWYRGVSAEWRPYMSEIYSTDRTALAVALAVPIRDRAGAVIGILASNQRLETLREWLLPIHVLGGDLLVVDRKGQLLFHRMRSGPEHLNDYVRVPAVERVLRGENGVAELDNPVAGGVSLAAYRWLPSLGWGVVVERRKNVALQRSRMLAAVSAGAALVLTGALVALGWIAVRSERKTVAAHAQLEAEIAERQRAEDALRQANTFLDSMVENIPHMIFVKDAKGLRFLRLNKAAETLLGFSRQDLIGKSDHDFFPKEDADFFTAKDREVLAGRAVVDIPEEPIRTASGDTRILHTKKIPLYDDAGTPQYLLGISEDITARKQAENALREAQHEAERADRAKSEFLSRMSHELRTPLNGILGFSQLLEREALTADQRESVEHILKGGRHLLTLINEVLDIARIEAGNLTISLEPVLTADVLRSALDLVRPQAAVRGVRLPPGMESDHYVMADRQRLQQVLLNLLSNAVKYNRDGGSVTVSCTEATPGRVQISMTDTGRGIAPALLERLYTPFDRLGADQGDIEGTGLGLAFSRRLVDAMNGVISVESQIGKGTTFTVELPAAQRPGGVLALPEKVAEAQIPTTRGSLLYIEDNLANLRLLERIVDLRPGLTLISAMQGSRGLELARAHQPRLIILDLHLPDLPGSEVLTRLREDPRTREIPVVILSADATHGQITRLLSQGAHAYLTKPLDVTQLLTLLDELLVGSRG